MRVYLKLFFIVFLFLKYEEINIAGGLKNVWELLGFLFQCEYNGFEANNFAPSVMPYK